MSLLQIPICLEKIVKIGYSERVEEGLKKRPVRKKRV